MKNETIRIKVNKELKTKTAQMYIDAEEDIHND